MPIDAIIFGGRTRDREPLIRVITDLAEAVYDGLTLGVEATFAAEGLDGQLRYDPMSMRPFLSYPEGKYAQHWLNILGQLAHPPVFAHVNWFQRDPDDGHYLWPGYRENLRALLWLIDYQSGVVAGNATPVGAIPATSELNLAGLNLPAGDLQRILSIDTTRWRDEMRHRGEHLAQFPDLPEAIRRAHERITQKLAQ
ncbi:phosphoenolpyruvate carboxykinase (GTP) [Arthrobacter sp. CAN_A214]